MTLGAFNVSPDPDDPKEIRFSLIPNHPTPVPHDQISLKSEVESILVILRALYKLDDEKFQQAYHRILSAAQGGVVGPSADPAIARDSLEVLKRDITLQEGGRIKNQYMIRLGWYALASGVIALVFALVSIYGLIWKPILIPANALIGHFCLLLVGCMAGVWLSFGARNVQFGFENLVAPERDHLEPAIRLIFAGLLTLIFGLMLSLKVVVIKIGPVSSDQFIDDVSLSLLIGAFCGLSEQALTDTITKRALAIFGKK